MRVDHQLLAADSALIADFVSALLSVFVSGLSRFFASVGPSDSRAFFLSGEA
jgi:hypothetical protein